MYALVKLHFWIAVLLQSGRKKFIFQLIFFSIQLNMNKATRPVQICDKKLLPFQMSTFYGDIFFSLQGYHDIFGRIPPKSSQVGISVSDEKESGKIRPCHSK